jgi:hypothetical protein
MLLTAGNRFNWWTSNATAPAAAAAILGTSLTSGAAHTLGSTTQVLAALAEDAYGILIVVNGATTTGTARNGLINIRVDPAGGTAWTDLIPNLQTAYAGFLSHATAGLTGYAHYYFPVFIKAGSTVGANYQATQATQTAGVWVTVYGKPSRPGLLRCGSYVEAFGADTANSRGTSVTAGTGSAEAASWTQLGSNTTRPFWWWQLGVSPTDATINVTNAMWDLAAGDVTNKDMILENQLHLCHTTETGMGFLNAVNAYREVPSGVGLYSRVSTNGVAGDYATPTAIAYGVGG